MSQKLKTALLNLNNNVIKLFNLIFNSKKNTCLFLTSLIMIFFIIVSIITYSQGYFFTIFSDDIIQYYPYVGGLFEKIKHNELSLYDTTLFGGTSFFANVYYLPFDIFTLLSFIFSFIFPAENVYAAFNFWKVGLGSLLMYYFFINKGYTTKSSFIGGLITFCCGMMQAYFIFPVYLGICFYVPLGMILVDKIIDKGGIFYLLMPIYILLVVLYDYYLAWMILAFIAIFYVIELHILKYNIFKNSFIKNKQFYKDFFKFIAVLIIGIMLSCFFLLPSAFYVLNESSRNETNIAESIWYYSIYDSEKGEYVFNLKHYFTSLCNMYIPNDPHRLCLVPYASYMREHFSLYMTSGCFIYFIYFFFINTKEANKLKFWVILFNIMLCIPLFSMFFTFNSVPYIRWFFMPLMLNIYASIYAINKADFKIFENKYLNLIPILVTLLGVGLLSFSLTGTELFEHYTKENDPYFYPILIVSLIILSLYLIVYIFDSIRVLIKNKKSLSRIIIPTLIVIEFIFASTVVFTNVGNSGKYYFNSKNEMVENKNKLYDLGFDRKDGFRINIDTNSARSITNANTLIGDVNFGTFFQSFYNTPLNGITKLYGCSDTSWSRVFNEGYNLLSSNMFNVKYIVVENNDNIYFPSQYKLLEQTEKHSYYSLENTKPVIIYDSVCDNYNVQIGKKEAGLLTSCYLTPKVEKEKLSPHDILLNKSLDLIKESGITYLSTSDLLNNTKDIYCSSLKLLEEETIDNQVYYKYDLRSLSSKIKDVITVSASDNSIKTYSSERMYVIDDNGNTHEMHYQTLYLDNTYTPRYLMIKKPSNSSYSYLNIYTYSYDFYNEFITKQNTYTNLEYNFDGSNIKISFDNPDNKPLIVKTGYAYSDDFKCDDYELVNVSGGFLGIIIPSNTSNVDINIYFSPAGFNTGLIITLTGGIIFLIITTGFILIKKGKKHEKNSSDSTVL